MVRGREGEDVGCELCDGVRGGLEEGRTGRSSSIISTIDEGGRGRMSDMACSESLSASLNRSRFSCVCVCVCVWCYINTGMCTMGQYV